MSDLRVLAQISVSGHLAASALVAANVRVDLDERIEVGQRTGRLVASLTQGPSNNQSIQVFVIATWSLPDSSDK